MDLFSVGCSDLQLFAIFMAEKLVGPRCVQIHLFEVDFSETYLVYISWQVLKTVFRSLQIWKLSGGGYSPPRYQKPTYGPAHVLIISSDCGNKMAIIDQENFF